MLGNLEEMQKAGRMQFDTASKSAMVFMKGAQRPAGDAVEQARENMERGSNYFEKISNARNFEDAFRANAEFAVANWERFFSNTTRMAETWANLARDASAQAREGAQASAQQAHAQGQQQAQAQARRAA